MTLHDLLSPAYDPDPALFCPVPNPSQATPAPHSAPICPLPVPARAPARAVRSGPVGRAYSPIRTDRRSVRIASLTAGDYAAPRGAGVIAWIAASLVGAVIALCCLAASWIGSVALSSLVSGVGGV